MHTTLRLSASALLLLLTLGLAHATTADDALTVADMTRSSTQRIAVQQAVQALVSESSDLDLDGVLEAPAMRSAATFQGVFGGVAGTFDGGQIPLASSAPKDDSYGVNLYYCSWDNGATSGSTGRFLVSGSVPTSPVFAVISAGINNQLETKCSDIAAGSNGQGDDYLIRYTSSQLLTGAGGALFFGDPVNVTSDLVPLQAAFSATPAMSLAKDGQIRLDKSTNTLYRWNDATKAFVTVGGGGGPWHAGTGTGTAQTYYSDNPVAIGTDTATHPLTVTTAGTGVPVGLKTQGPLNGLELLSPTTGTNGFIGFDNTNNRLVLNATSAGGQIALQIAGTTYLSVANNGNIGIGSATPLAPLSFGPGALNMGIPGANPAIRLYDDGTNTGAVYGVGVNGGIGGLEISANQAGKDIRFYAGTNNSSPTLRMTIGGDGTVAVPGSVSAGRVRANASGLLGGASQATFDVGAGTIGAGNSIYSYGSICAGNSAADCSGVGGTVITAAGISIGGAPVLTTNNIKANVNGSMITSLRTDAGTDIGVAQMMRWKRYGDNHVIFDASAGLSPEGTVVDTQNPQNAWGASYPTLMGWNGVNTYGVRVDSARTADLVARVSDETGMLRIVNPGGASLATTLSSVSGAIKIKLPVATFHSNTMMRFTVRIFDYNGAGAGTSRTLEIGGYNYNVPNSWYNTFATQTTMGGSDINVRFGNDGTSDCVWIGETASVWYYPQVAVTDFQAGYNAATDKLWGTGWNVSLVSSFGTITNGPFVAGKNLTSQNISGYAPTLGGGGAYGAWNISAGGLSEGASVGNTYNSAWYRSIGNVGWYNQTYGSGIWMSDASWVRVYGGAGFYVANYLSTSTGLQVSGSVVIDANRNFYSNDVYIGATGKWASQMGGGDAGSLCGISSYSNGYWSPVSTCKGYRPVFDGCPAGYSQITWGSDPYGIYSATCVHS